MPYRQNKAIQLKEGFSMKRILFSRLAILLSFGALAATANAAQVGPNNSDADLNGDGKVTLTELKRYNRIQCQS
jgi:hypothetical protein